MNRRNTLVKSVLDKLPQRLERNCIQILIQQPKINKQKDFCESKRESLPELSTRRPVLKKQSEHSLDSETIYQTLEKAEFQ
jgi:hypothetical protein